MKLENIIVVVFLILLFSSCNSELDLENPNSVSSSEYWNNGDEALAGIDAVYQGLITDGYYMRMTPAMTDSRGDDFTGNSPWAQLNQSGKFTLKETDGELSTVWDAYYTVVYRANQVLEKVPEIDSINKDLQNRILGQAHFLRGLTYFHLKTNFQKVPLILTVPQSQDDYNTETASEEDIWDQIVLDFKKANDLLPVDYSSVSGPDSGDKGRATKGAAMGFLGKTYLYRKEWQLAADNFDTLINGPDLNNYALMDDYRDNFDEDHKNNEESLFEVQFAKPDEVGGSEMQYAGDPSSSSMQVSSIGHTYAQAEFGYNDFLPTSWIYEEYKKEKTTDGGLDPRLLVTIASYEPDEESTMAYNTPWLDVHDEDAIYPRKYTHDGLGDDSESEGSTELSGINYKLMRYSDVLLMYAEALNELGRTGEAYPYIQEVRDRADLPDLEDKRPNMSQEEMRNQLAHERALELAIESIRIHDIIRWGWLEDSDKLEELRDHDDDFNTYETGKEYFPIPQSEMDVNPNLEPNSAN